ncbi:MAG TPA: carbon-nitrogen hydrolase family protein [Gemmatimonadales bacterium]|nr:carbon-nitrogen hydrolase family protein [Gemmatimonadales bacterium]
MRVTVCELPHEPEELDAAWAALCEHTRSRRSQLVLLPEFAMLDPVWESDRFDSARWSAIEAAGRNQIQCLPALGVEHVVGTRPVCVDGRRLNQAYHWSARDGIQPLRSKYFMPEQPGNWEATWFHPGDPAFPCYRAGPASFGVNICTELWALETYGRYAAQGVDMVLSPRATSAATAPAWLPLGVVAAIRSGAYCLSSNRVDRTGACGRGSWIIDPAGTVLALTSATMRCATREIDLMVATEAKGTYPRNALRAWRQALSAAKGSTPCGS